MPAASRKAYCGCLSNRLDALDDATITTATAAAHKNLQDRAQARIAGEPEPAPVTTVLDGIERDCKQAPQ